MAQQVINAESRETAARVDALLPDQKFSKAQIGLLEEQVKAAGDNFDILRARYRAGTVTMADVFEARALPCFAMGRLAWAKGDLLQCQEEYDDAVATWKQRLEIVRSQYKVGTVDYITLSAAEAEGKEYELCASKVKGRIAAGESRRPDLPPVPPGTTLLTKSQLTLKGHSGAVECVAFGPDGKRIVSGSLDGTLTVWDANTGREFLTLKPKGYANVVPEVCSVAYSPDGKRIISGSFDGPLTVWDATTGREALTLKGHPEGVYSVAFSPDGKRIVCGSSSDPPLKVWDATTGREALKLKGHTGVVCCVAFSPDGKRIVSGGDDGTLTVWDANTGREALTIKGHTGGVCSVAFSPDGKRIVSGSFDRTLKVWDAMSGQEIPTVRGHTRAVFGVAFSPDGKRIVSGSDDGTVKVWDAASGRATLTLKGHTDFVGSVAFSPDGKRIVSGSWDGTLKVWDVASAQESAH